MNHSIMATQKHSNYAYATLITRASYLAGVIILANTLAKQGSQYPLVVLYARTLNAGAIRALESESTKCNIILKPCDLLLPPENTRIELIAKRFTDTWTKLRVFELFDYDLMCYLDADMMCVKNMDEIFSRVDLPEDHIAAAHDCVCNADKVPWATPDRNSDNCAYTAVSHPEALTNPIQPTPDSRPTYRCFNSGMFLYRPTKKLWDSILDIFSTTDQLSSFKFPDQDFLNMFFRDRWHSLPWQFNARKTMRYRHTNIWRDKEVVCLHYIVDKPWTARVGEDGIAGYKGLDGVTHSWWWTEYQEWEASRAAEGAVDMLDVMRRYVASEDGGEQSDEDMRDIGSKVQSFTFAKQSEVNGEGEESTEGNSPRIRESRLS
jgi:lipopolysaccharide biosynthesis glycosyltransferase